MKNVKLLKSILIPTLGISAIGTIATVFTSCSCGNPSVSVTGVSLDQEQITLTEGENRTLVATVLPENATNKAVTWSSDKDSIATVDENGTVTAKTVGTATITVKTNDGDKTATCLVTVNRKVIPVTGVSLDQDEITLTKGENRTLVVTISPQDATNKAVTWSSDKDSIATVDENGTVTAKTVGTTIITATSVDNPNAVATCVVIVNNPYVVIVANEDSTLSLTNNDENNPDLQYSTDKGDNWSPYSAQMSIAQGQRLYLKGDNPNGWSYSTSQYSRLDIDGDVSIFGNVMGLLDDGNETMTEIPCSYCFYQLFNSSIGITSVSEDFLPATSLKYNCYERMFSNCTSLTTAPDLPATSLADGCYRFMFQDCKSLTTAPDLPATSLVSICYWSMFEYCSSLNSIRIGYTGDYNFNYFNEWVNDVAPSGTFHYNGNDTVSNFGFPNGWEIEHFDQTN